MMLTGQVNSLSEDVFRSSELIDVAEHGTDVVERSHLSVMVTRRTGCFHGLLKERDGFFKEAAVGLDDATHIQCFSQTSQVTSRAG